MLGSPADASHDKSAALWPLCTHTAAQSVIETDAGPVSAASFVTRARQLAAQIPEGVALLNVCQSPFGFTLGFAAALMRGCVTLMPANFAPETVRLLQRSHPSPLLCLHDGSPDLPDLPQRDLTTLLQADAQMDDGDANCVMPQFPGSQLAALVFTSGSTGEPSGHRKTWGKLVLNARSAQARLAWPTGTLVATVPAQHMYGFESCALLTLQGGHRMWHGKPMLPADIAHALQQSPAPRTLVSTPWHLSLLLDAMDTGLALPAVDAVLSATAPLSTALAQRVENAFAAPVSEIYGSTETGQIATHRTVASSDWQLLDGVALSLGDDNVAWVSDGHIEGRVPLSDIVTDLGAGHFRLIGRRADMVNIAGKRHSMAALNAILQRIPGVKDGCFFDPGSPEAEADHAPAQARIQRLCAFVVAPGLEAKAITQALRAHLDPVFLPRPLWLLDSLPRNATSKLPRSALQALHAQLTRFGA